MPRGGKKNNSRGRGGRGRGGGRGGWGPSSGARQPYVEVTKQNERFERFYNELSIVPEGEEREEFWSAIKRELPNSFRFAGSKGHALAVQKRLVEHYVPEITSVKYNDEPVEPPKPIPWYPEQLAWAMTTPKNVVRKFPPFASFQKFLVSETSVGNISRQEVVSMIPPLLMDIKPGMAVLDLCAAPGSKSAQLIEMVHGGEEARVRKVLHDIAQKEKRQLSPDGMEVKAEMEQANSEEDWSDDGRSTGLLIANDVDYRRAQMLVHQVKRLNSPNLIVMNHDATLFPSIELPKGDGQKSSILKFDRILADVPCSGDGTCRKNPNIWKDWIPGNGLGLHCVQVRILVRALQMLKVGGRVVYSTCSMNPVENEAVIASAVDRCGGLAKVNMVDCSDKLPGLKRNHGLSQWKVMDKAGRIWSSWAEVDAAKEKAGPDDESFARLVEAMFPPTDEKLPFERCMRVYPHQQDTGGFFITVLEKRSEIRARPESEPKKVKSNLAPSIISVVNEIEASTANGDDPDGLHHLESLDKLVPIHTNPDDDMDNGNAPPVARQNQSNSQSVGSAGIKRGLDEYGEASSAKKIRLREGAEDPNLPGEQDRQVHWPPPPGAELSLTEHRHDDGAPPLTYPPPGNELDEPTTPVDEDTDAGVSLPSQTDNRTSKRKNNQPHEEPFKYLDPSHPELLSIYAFYSLSPRFPRDRFMVRNATGEPVKAVYYTSALACRILEQNEGKGMKFVHCGVKMFMKQDAQGRDICRWRIQSEGLPIVEAWVGEGRVVRLWRRETLRRLLIEMFPKVAADGWQELGEIGERVRDIGMGCCVLRVEASDAEDGFEERMVLPLWRSVSSLNLMLPKEERRAMLLRLYNDSSPLIDHSQEQRAARTEPNHAQPSSTRPNYSATQADVDAATNGGNKVKGVNGGIGKTEDPVALTAYVEAEASDAEDAALAAAQVTRDEVREVAPGVADEDDRFNRTV
ncbi:hypothetical protein B0A49_00240 [Cryomyces minteri]|uniref:SAM-dependent MTase RsmB/NOP-type domain-containing protein n=1 Tax=Cryomyces minteri TaxID=331657 RepID=A0A4U0XYQ3_9PEZI|nr:hypothetical protein B0A49_00240 [Cryomyces minteri]